MSLNEKQPEIVVVPLDPNVSKFEAETPTRGRNDPTDAPDNHPTEEIFGKDLPR